MVESEILTEAKDNNHSVSAGMQQAIATGELIDVPFIFSSNGDAFMMCDRTRTEGQREREIPLDQFPTPEDLWQKYCNWKGIDSEIQGIISQDYYPSPEQKQPRYYQQIAINRTIEAIAKGQNRILLVMATGTGKTFTAFIPSVGLVVIKSGYVKDIHLKKLLSAAIAALP